MCKVYINIFRKIDIFEINCRYKSLSHRKNIIWKMYREEHSSFSSSVSHYEIDILYCEFNTRCLKLE